MSLIFKSRMNVLLKCISQQDLKPQTFMPKTTGTVTTQLPVCKVDFGLWTLLDVFPPHVLFHGGCGGSVQQLCYRGARICATLFLRNHYKTEVKNIPFIPTCRNGSFSSSWYTIIALMELIWFLRRNLSWVCICPSNFFFKMFKRQPSMLSPVKKIAIK